MSVEENKVEENKAVIRAWLAARHAHDVEAGVALWRADRQEWLRNAFNGFSQGFPDLRVTVTEIMGDGDKVAVWWTLHGTHHGLFRGIPATGKAINWEVADLYTMTNYQIASLVRRAENLSALLQQP